MRYSLGLAAILLASQALAQYCEDPGFLLCYAPDSSSDISSTNTDTSGASSNNVAPSNDMLFDSSFWGPLQSVASLPIGKRNLRRRQGSEVDDVLCCNPYVDCLAIDDIPFCYVSTHSSSTLLINEA